MQHAPQEFPVEIQKQVQCARELGDIMAETPYVEAYFKEWGVTTVEKLPPSDHTYRAMYEIQSEGSGHFYFGFQGGLTWYCDDGLNAVALEFTDDSGAITVLSVKDVNSEAEFKGITMAVVDLVEAVLKDIGN